MQYLPLEKIGVDPRYYPRVGGKPDWYSVHVYADALKADPRKADPKAGPKVNPFPPVKVIRRAGWDFPFMLIDGLHRMGAHRQAGFEVIAAEIERLPKSKWLARAVELNVHQEHRNFEPRDKAMIAEYLAADGWTEKKIAGLLQMPIESLIRIRGRVQRVSKSEAKRLTKQGVPVHDSNGHRFAVSKAAVGKAMASGSVVKAMSSQGPMHTASYEGVLDECIAVLESGVVDPKVAEVLERLETIEQLIQGMTP